MAHKKGDIDWNALKVEFMTTDMSLNAIREKHNIADKNHFYKKTEDWKEERRKLHEKTLQKIKSKALNNTVKEWERQQKLWHAVEIQAGRLLQSSLDKKKVLKAGEVMALTVAIEKALKCQKLILGESTENIATHSIHKHLIEINKRIESGADLEDIPQEVKDEITEDTNPL